MPTTPSEPIKYLEQSELKRLMAAIQRHGKRAAKRDLAIFIVAYWRGLRASEVGALQYDDYHPETERLYVRRVKGSNSAEYKLCPEEVKVLKAWVRFRGQLPGPMFPAGNVASGRPISRQRLHNLMKRYGELAKIPPDKRHFHTLRHSIAVHLVDLNTDLLAIQDWLGHRSIDSTMVYAKLRSSTRDKIAQGVYAATTK